MAIKDKSFGVIPVKKVEKSWYKFLLIQHKDWWHWDFPKWHPEEWESQIETAQREFREETWIEKINILEDESFENRYLFNSNGQTIEKTVVFFIGFVCWTQKINIQEEEVNDYKRCDYQKSLEVITFDNAKEVLEKAKKFLEKINNKE